MKHVSEYGIGATSDDRDEIPLPPHGTMRSTTPLKPETRIACAKCGTSTLLAMLSQYGGQCNPCYEQWRNTPRKKPDHVEGFGLRGDDGKAWARALRLCEFKRGGLLPNGTRMTPFQMFKWREVLGEDEAA